MQRYQPRVQVREDGQPAEHGLRGDAERSQSRQPPFVTNRHGDEPGGYGQQGEDERQLAVAELDQTVDRVWSGGLRTSPVKNLGISFTGNYVRATGMGEIAGELPMYGPMSFPYATGSIYYDFPRVGRLNVQLQRTYYIEQIVPGNNFGAKMLTLSWTKNF